MRFRSIAAVTIVTLGAAVGVAGTADAHPIPFKPFHTNATTSGHTVKRAATGGGFNGPVISRPDYPPEDYAAGEVCPFPVHVDDPVNKVTIEEWTNDAGQPVYDVGYGPLNIRVRNNWTGKTVVRWISGNANFSYPDPTSPILTGNEIAVTLHKGDNPPNHLYIIGKRDYAAIRAVHADGHTTKTLLYLSGHPEDLCKTLAPR
ncbi:hypothetical protein [Actinomadura rupiterrae]|uniref:hypothetical protein n=1 Tax=Actinomadura rupiterrae TaxID=559627 RepID=UPI0020A4A981|nr:hypothetical protein [Actinomadura rupiterrae]MCP2338922.1 hypothetical protein [Actinomadura rupiterrae]